MKRKSESFGENDREHQQTGNKTVRASRRAPSPWRAVGLISLLLLIQLAKTAYALDLPSVVPLTPVTPPPGYLPEVVPLTPVTPAPGFLPEIVPLTPVTPTPSPTATPLLTPGLADWVLSVDDNATLSLEGITYYVNLYISMNKDDGRDVTGAYTGKILYTSSVDEADLARIIESNTDSAFIAGYMNYTIEAVSASIEVIKFNEQMYNEFWGGEPVTADFMAIATVDMSMRSQSHISTQSYMGPGEGGGYDEEIIFPVEICFLITGGQVKAYIGIHPDEKAFSGMLIGTLP